MSEKEKAKVIEEHLPKVQSIIDEYRKQGRTLTVEEAEKVREQIREGLKTGHLDAMENMGTVLGENALDQVAGGGIGPTPTTPDILREQTTMSKVKHRPE